MREVECTVKVERALAGLVLAQGIAMAADEPRTVSEVTAALVAHESQGPGLDVAALETALGELVGALRERDGVF